MVEIFEDDNKDFLRPLQPKVKKAKSRRTFTKHNLPKNRQNKKVQKAENMSRLKYFFRDSQGKLQGKSKNTDRFRIFDFLYKLEPEYLSNICRSKRTELSMFSSFSKIKRITACTKKTSNNSYTFTIEEKFALSELFYSQNILLNKRNIYQAYMINTKDDAIL